MEILEEFAPTLAHGTDGLIFSPAYDVSVKCVEGEEVREGGEGGRRLEREGRGEGG